MFVLKALTLAAVATSTAVACEPSAPPNSSGTPAPEPIPGPVDLSRFSKGDPTNCKNLPDKDRVGFDLPSHKNVTVNRCASSCASSMYCATWVRTDERGGSCWLKSRVTPLVDRPGAIATECTWHVPPPQWRPYKDVEFVGYDITNKPAKKADDCPALCLAESGCRVYSFNRWNNGTCWLKSDVGQTNYRAGMTSATALPLSDGICAAEYDIEFVGNDLANQPAKDAGECCSQCKAVPKCKTYTWNDVNGGTCWMKNSGKNASTPTEPKKGSISAAILVY